MAGTKTSTSKKRGESDSRQIAVVIPAYCAAPTIQRVLLGIPEVVSHIIVVDDCSPDNTADLVRIWDDPRLHLISLSQNQGVGGAVLAGYAAALGLGAEIIVKMDSDDQMDPAYLLSLIAPILAGEADYAKGNRFLHMYQLRSMPWLRRIGNAGLSFFTKLASGYWNVFDPTNGYTAIHALLVPMLRKESLDRRFFFECSMLLELSLLRAVVRDVSIPARYTRQASFLSERQALFEFPPRLLKGLVSRCLVQYFLSDFTALSVFLVVGSLLTLFGLVFGGYHWYLSAITGITASTGTVMLAVLPIILGGQLLLQAVIADIQNVPTHPLHLHLELLRQVQGDFSADSNAAT